MEDTFDHKKFTNLIRSNDSDYRNARVAAFDIYCQGMSIKTRIDFVVTSPSESVWVAKELETCSRSIFDLNKKFKLIKKPKKHEKVQFLVQTKFILENLKLDIKSRINQKRQNNLTKIYRSDSPNIGLR